MYENSKIKGPYICKDGRMRIYVDGSVVSYPKFLMEKHLNRKLNRNETVDHIDMNPLNNDISNLRVVDRRQHAYNDVTRNKDVVVKCSYCGKEFVVEGSKMRTRNRHKGYGYFCSKTCSGKFGAGVQNGEIIPEVVNRIYPEKVVLHNFDN